MSKSVIIRDGRMYYPTRGYQYRMGNPETDVNIHGKPIQSNYVVIVKNGKTEMAFPHAHGLTNKVYGPKATDEDGVSFPIFWVEDNWIYKTIVREGE